jgi:mono/diheme cytochrome c family protein
MKKATAILFLSMTFGSCYYDNEAALYGEEICSPDEATYSGTIAPIISNSCLSCHSQSVASGGVVLSDYAGVKQQAQNGKLIGTITHSGGFSPMPQNAPQLSDCKINAIRSWIDSGALNN